MGKQPSSECDQIEEARQIFIQELSQNMHHYGITESIGRLYGTVLFAEHPLTLDEMSTSLGMSKTSMSTGIRVLMEANMVDKAWQKGVRKDLYQPIDDWYRSFSTVFVKRWQTSVENNLLAVHQMRDTLVQLKESQDQMETTNRIDTDLEKLNHAENYYKWLTEVTELFESGEIYELIPKK